MSTTHIVRFIAASVTSANKLGTSTSVTVATDFVGGTGSVTVRQGNVVAEQVSAENDENGFPLLTTLTLWRVNELGKPWTMLPKPKVGDIVFQVGDGTGVFNGSGGVITETGFLRFDISVSSMFTLINSLDSRITALEAP